MRPRSRSAPYVCDCVGVFVSLWEPVRELEPEKWGHFFFGKQGKFRLFYFLIFWSLHPAVSFVRQPQKS